MKRKDEKIDPISFHRNGMGPEDEELLLARMLRLDGNRRSVPVSRTEDYGRDNVNSRKRIAMQAVILRLIIDNHDTTIKSIADATGLSKQSSGCYVINLEKLGHITSELAAPVRVNKKFCNSTRKGRLFAEGEVA